MGAEAAPCGRARHFPSSDHRGVRRRGRLRHDEGPAAPLRSRRRAVVGGGRGGVASRSETGRADRSTGLAPDHAAADEPGVPRSGALAIRSLPSIGERRPLAERRRRVGASTSAGVGRCPAYRPGHDHCAQPSRSQDARPQRTSPGLQRDARRRDGHRGRRAGAPPMGCAPARRREADGTAGDPEQGGEARRRRVRGSATPSTPPTSTTNAGTGTGIRSGSRARRYRRWRGSWRSPMRSP